jgi:hypothetical protein
MKLETLTTALVGPGVIFIIGLVFLLAARMILGDA